MASYLFDHRLVLLAEFFRLPLDLLAGSLRGVAVSYVA